MAGYGYDYGFTPVPGSYDEGARQTTMQPQQQQPQQAGGAVVPAAAGTYFASRYPSLFGAPAGAGETIAGGQVFSPAGEAVATANPGFVPPSTGYGPLGQLGGAALMAHGLYNIGSNWGRSTPARGALAGGEMGAGAMLLGASPWAVPAAAVLGAGLGMVKSGKHDDQYKRDAVRAEMQKAGFIDENYGLELADGTKFNIGLDGGARPEYSFSGGRRPYEVNAENKFSGQAVGWANPLAYVLTGGDKKLSTDYAGYFANAAMSNAQTVEGVRANMLKIMEDLKLTPDTIAQKIDELLAANRITAEEAAAFKNGVGTLIAGDPKLYTMQSVAEMEQAMANQPPPVAATPAPAPSPAPEAQMDAAVSGEAPMEPVARPTAKRIMSFNDAKFAGRH